MQIIVRSFIKYRFVKRGDNCLLRLWWGYCFFFFRSCSCVTVRGSEYKNHVPSEEDNNSCMCRGKVTVYRADRNQLCTRKNVIHGMEKQVESKDHKNATCAY